jgi:hypothetical protein
LNESEPKAEACKGEGRDESVSGNVNEVDYVLDACVNAMNGNRRVRSAVRNPKADFEREQQEDAVSTDVVHDGVVKEFGSATLVGKASGAHIQLHVDEAVETPYGSVMVAHAGTALDVAQKMTMLHNIVLAHQADEVLFHNP